MAKLYVVATPIGNLNDLTDRAREALAECDCVFAEDTRVTMKLLSSMGITKPMYSCHRHNEEKRADWGIAKIVSENLTAALTCDAGTPGISDPGDAFINAAWEAGIEVIPISGPSAVATAISVSGFDAREFAFYGFLPRENKAIDEKLNKILLSGVGVCVLYESPHRIENLLKRISIVLPASSVCVCCDLTKKFEKITRGGISEVYERIKNDPNIEKGEYAVVLDISKVEKPKAPEIKMRAELVLLDALLNGETFDEALQKAAESGASRNEIYKAKLSVGRLLGYTE